MQKSATNATLLAEAKKYYAKNSRSNLPWRKTHNPYKIMVSEVMLQQTQVDRVVPFYKNFIKQFPTATALARASLSDLLRAWNGLGYNRRAKLLRNAAQVIIKDFGGKFTTNVEKIELLPGIGPYTSRAIATFAFNQPHIFIETNIRTVFLHHCNERPRRSLIADAEILPLVEEVLKRSKMEPREFYWMLMDYGSCLKKSGVRLNSRSKHYTKQSKFEGSRRQLRGQILKLLLKKPLNEKEILLATKRKAKEVRDELARLQKEKLIIQRKNKFFISK